MSGGPEVFRIGTGFKFKGRANGGGAGARLQDRIGVQTPPEVIWDLVYDLPGWSRWNPLFTSAAGEVRIGKTLTLTQVLAGGSPKTIQPTVLEWVPNEQLHWRLSMFAGLAHITHYIEIEKLNDSSCIVANGEIIEGFLAPFVPGRGLRRGLHEMNLALKAAAEAAWRDEVRAPTSGAR
jgi:hypothetical protein